MCRSTISDRIFVATTFFFPHTFWFLRPSSARAVFDAKKLRKGDARTWVHPLPLPYTYVIQAVLPYFHAVHVIYVSTLGRVFHDLGIWDFRRDERARVETWGDDGLLTLSA